MFSGISAALSKRSARTLPQLHSAIYGAFTLEPITVDLNNLLNIKSWLLGYVKRLRNNFRPHALNFIKSKRRMWRCCIYKTGQQWEKRHGCLKKELYTLLKEEPKGRPRVLDPEYKEFQHWMEFLGASSKQKPVLWETYIEQEVNRRKLGQQKFTILYRATFDRPCLQRSKKGRNSC